MMNEEIAEEILDQLFSSLEALETQSAAILQFLKQKGIASEEDLAVHFEQAGNASSVRWRAARVRIDHLLSSAIKTATQEAPTSEQPKSSENKQEPSVKSRKTSQGKNMELSSEGDPAKENQASEEVAGIGKSETKKEQQVNPSAGNNRKENERTSESPEHATNSDSSQDAPSRKTA